MDSIGYLDFSFNIIPLVFAIFNRMCSICSLLFLFIILTKCYYCYLSLLPLSKLQWSAIAINTLKNMYLQQTINFIIASNRIIIDAKIQL